MDEIDSRVLRYVLGTLAILYGLFIMMRMIG
jgi:hypothetical protein